MRRYTVIIRVGVLANNEQAAWEYGDALASRAPKQVTNKVDEDPDAEESQVDVREAD